jgi:putative ABC transport system permease protein
VLRLFRVLHVRQLTRQPVRTLLATAALGAGVAITVAASLLTYSLDESIRDVFRDLSGPNTLTVTGPLDRSGLDASLPARIAKVDGVGSAAPAVSAVAVGERRDGSELHFIAIGLDCGIEAFVGAFGCDDATLEPVRPGAPVLMSASLRRELGAGAVMRSDADRVQLEGVAVNDSLDDVNDGRVAIFALRTAQQLFGRPDRIDVAYVRPANGSSIDALYPELSRAVGGWNTVLRPGELPPYMRLNGPLIAILGLAAFLSLGISALLVYNIVALSLAERRRDIAVATAVGSPPRRIVAGVLLEAGAMGLAGGLLGAVGGIGFAVPLVRTISSVLIEQSIGVPIALHVSIVVLAIGVATGVLTAVLAAWVPARRTRRIEVAAELHGRAVRLEEAPRRAGVRLSILVGLGAVSVAMTYLAKRNGGLEMWQSRLGTLALVTTSASMLAAVGTASPLVLRLVLRPLRSTGGPLRIAVSNLVSNARRTSVMAAAVGAAVGLACVLGAIVPAIRAATSGALAITGDRVYASTVPMNNAGASARPSASDLEKISRLPGVAAIEQHRCVSIGNRSVGLGVCSMFFHGRPAFPPIAGEVSAAAIERGEAIVGTSAARSNGLRPGSTLRLATPTGFEDVRVAGIWATPNDNGYRVSLSEERFVDIFGREPAENVYVVPEEGVSSAEIVQRIEAAGLDADLYALTPQQASARLADEVGDQVTPFWTLQRLLLFVALLATLTTLLLVGVQRRRELGVLGAVGFSPSSLGRMTVAEALTGGLTGSVLGIVASFAMFEAIRNAAGVSIGASPPWAFSPTSAVVSTALALIVVAVGAMIPAWRTSRLQIVEAIRDE